MQPFKTPAFEGYTKSELLFGHLWISKRSKSNKNLTYSKNSYNKTTFGSVQKWSLRPLLNSLKGGLFLDDTECRKHTERMNDTF